MTTGSTPPNPDALIDQLWDYLQGELAPEHVEAFEAALRNSPETIQAGVDLIEVMVMAREVCQREGQARKELFLGSAPEHRLDDVIRAVADPQRYATETTLAELAKLEAQAETELVDLSIQSRRKQRPTRAPKQDAICFNQLLDVSGYVLRHSLKSKAAAITGLAAALLLALFLLTPWSSESPDPIADNADPKPTESAPPILRDTPATTPVATLTASHNATWSGSAEGALAPGSQLHPGDRLTLTAGFAEITTHRGAIAILQAPVTIELLDNDNALRLHAGKLVGLCHTESSKGFVVKTDHADITDLGTEFGVEARPNGVEAMVFVGEIEINIPGGSSQRVTHSQTARLSVRGSNRELVVEDRVPAGYSQRLPRAALVTAAHINLEGHEVQVVPQGVAEDARVRTDRDHEINGIDEGGIPTALLGGDLVRTPSDASRSRGLEIALELARPATVYLLVPNFDGQVPLWLTEQYVPTKMRVGIDHGLALADKSDPKLIGVGPGQSIDDQRVVWRRKHVEVGRVTVGGSMLNTSSIYGIIVVPADESGVGRP